ncbi:Uncharacterised protein [Mycobacteroides abscessus subsp. abscessus]|nr:Uncharacterised protein [Mycobacteroides abscessus subsp. abscessus]
MISTPVRWARARANACSVGSPSMRSAKWFDSRSAARKLREVAFWVVQPISAMKIGISGRVKATINAEGQSVTSSTTPMITGTVAARPSCGRYLE